MARAFPPTPRNSNSNDKIFGFSFSGGPVVSFFNVDTHQSEKAHSLPGFSGSFRVEIYPSSSMHFQIGMEFMTQACRFNSYYFAPGYSIMYNHSFGYDHTLRTLELNFPITARIGFNENEENARSIFYVVVGYAPKLLLHASTNIVQTSGGKDVWHGSTKLEYEHHYLGLQTGNLLIGGMGLDRRFGFSEKFLSYEIIFNYTLSRFIYKGRIGDTNTNDLLIKNSCINFQIGYRF